MGQRDGTERAPILTDDERLDRDMAAMELSALFFKGISRGL